MYTLVGYEKVDYTNKQNVHITGHRLHLTYDSDKIQGSGVESVYVSPSVDVPKLALGQKVDVLYNRFGKVSAITVL